VTNVNLFNQSFLTSCWLVALYQGDLLIIQKPTP
jgi:hypothetical protein